MRTLWLFIAVLILAGGLVAVLSESPTEPQPRTDERAQSETPIRPVRPEPTKTDPATTNAQALADELATAAEERSEQAATAETDPPRDAQATAAPPSNEDSSSLTIGLDRTIPHATVIPGDIQAVSPNELSVDGEFTLRGEGTKESPYEPTWEYLFSAADTYQPRLSEDEIPQRIALLDGKWIRITGYAAFPLVVGKTSEMLIMLNKWDGCCIGVPPTPFDAIEVRLTEAVDRGPKHQINFGTVMGKMKVDPYLIENWLVGLYILEESSLSSGL